MGAEEPVALTRKRSDITHVGTAGLDIGMPVQVRGMPIWKMVLVRVLRTYLSTFLGLLTLDASGLAKITVVEQWGMLSTIAVVSGGPTLLSLLHNVVDFLTKLDMTNPEWRG